MDQRSTMFKVIQLMKDLVNYYTEPISHKDIEYLIATKYGYTDPRTIRKFFQLLEDYYFIEPSPKARPICQRRFYTKQNRNRGELNMIMITGSRYCYEHYQFGPRAPSRSEIESRFPRPPLQRTMDERAMADAVNLCEETGKTA